MDKSTDPIIELTQARVEIQAKHTELCNAIGAYIISFENLFEAIKQAIYEILKRNGISDRTFTNVIVADLTADYLFKKFDALLLVSLPEEYKDKTFQKRYQDTYNGIMNAIIYRNQIAHTHWHIALKYDHETKKASTKLTGNLLRNKKGKGAENKFKNADYRIIEELKNQSGITYLYADRVQEIIINIRDKFHLNRIWLEE